MLLPLSSLLEGLSVVHQQSKCSPACSAACCSPSCRSGLHTCAPNMSLSGCEDTSAGAASAVAVAAGSMMRTAAGSSADMASVSSTVTFAVSASPLQHQETHAAVRGTCRSRELVKFKTVKYQHLEETYLCATKDSRGSSLGPLHSTLLCVCAAEGRPSPSPDKHSRAMATTLL
ncbi:hypothetical protein COO60DRAFT_130351 [Scenedesmus sp. NREL 46B-D3]|nr:hypothetical protein COO60DRAFT_130351 [Scenedesmus sp. NREL 46B-D3]